jgi:hypothetical protein
MGLLRRIDSGDEGEKDQSHKPQPLGQDSHDSLASSSAYLDLKTRVRSKLLAAMKTSTTAADKMVKELVGDDNDSVWHGLGGVAARRTKPG